MHTEIGSSKGACITFQLINVSGLQGITVTSTTEELFVGLVQCMRHELADRMAAGRLH